MKKAGGNYTGNQLEKFIEDRLKEKGYKFIVNKKFKPALYLQQPLYSKRYHIGKGLYETPMSGITQHMRRLKSPPGPSQSPGPGDKRRNHDTTKRHLIIRETIPGYHPSG